MTSADVVNQALAYIASQTRISALNDGTPAANSASTVYTPIVQMLLRELDPDFARIEAVLPSAGITPIAPWAFVYQYPSNCLRLRQVKPATIPDPNDPQPIRSEVGFDTGSAVKVIWSNQATAHAVYTSSAVTESIWDTVFTQAVVWRLAAPLAMALSGRPDFARETLQASANAAAMTEMVDESAVRQQ